MRHAVEADWINRFLKRLDQLDSREGVLSTISFALEQYRADPECSPERIAEAFAQDHPLS
jgi:hypothetical protein